MLYSLLRTLAAEETVYFDATRLQSEFSIELNSSMTVVQERSFESKVHCVPLVLISLSSGFSLSLHSSNNLTL